MVRVESVLQLHYSPHRSPILPPQGVHLSREPSLVRQAKSEKEVIMPQGLVMDIDAQVLPTNMEDKVGGQQGLARVVEEEVEDDEIESFGQPPP